VTNDQGSLDLQRLPFGIYQLAISQSGFAPVSESVQIVSSIPTDQAGSVNQIGSNFIQNRLSSIPGRSIQDLVNSQPGWLYEGNAVLHPRGSEYQTQFVVDGIPLTDNRSPSFGPEIGAEDVQSMGNCDLCKRGGIHLFPAFRPSGSSPLARSRGTALRFLPQHRNQLLRCRRERSILPVHKIEFPRNSHLLDP
jgi:hypothetical protein